MGMHSNRFFKKPNSFADWCLFFIRWLFLLLFLSLTAGLCFFNRNSRFIYNMGFSVAVSIALFFSLLICSKKIKDASTRNRTLKRLLLHHNSAVFVLCILLLFVFQCRFDYALYRPIGWDVSAIVQCAGNLNYIHTNDYFSEFPNNLLLVYILHILLRIYAFFGGNNSGSNIWMYLAVINTIIVDLSIILTFLIIRKLWGIKAGFVSFGIGILLFGFSPWILVPYSDTFSMWVTPAAFMLFLKARETTRLPIRVICYFLIGFTSIIGYFIKPFTLIMTVAVILIMLIKSFGSIKRFFAFLLAFITIIAGCGSAYALNRVQVTDRLSSQLNFSKQIPFTHFLMMGLNIQTSGSTHRDLYGAYNAADYTLTLRQKTQKEKVNLNIKIIKDRLRAFGPGGYMLFLAKKANWIFSDGVFWVEGEGDDVDVQNVSSDPISSVIQDYFRFYGWNFPWFSDTVQGVWILVMFLMVCPLFLKRDDYRDEALMIARIAVLGLLFYLLLSEARSRYLISFIPIMLVLAGYGFSLFSYNLERIQTPNISNITGRKP